MGRRKRQRWKRKMKVKKAEGNGRVWWRAGEEKDEATAGQGDGKKKGKIRQWVKEMCARW